MTMDRELDASYRYRRLGRRAAVGGGALALCVVVLILLPGWLRPSVEREQVRMGRWTAGRSRGLSRLREPYWPGGEPRA